MSKFEWLKFEGNRFGLTSHEDHTACTPLELVHWNAPPHEQYKYYTSC